jgi:hypothetical protein
MKSMESQINLRISNNTALPQPVSILGIVPNQNTANNNNFLYEFNFTGQSYAGITNVNINIANTSNPAVVVYNAPVTSQSIIGVVDALNTLNQGLFSYSGTTIYVSSNYYIYSNISIAGISILGSNIFNPIGIVVDTFGNIYVANGGAEWVTKITPNNVSTVFGLFPILDYCASIVINSIGNVFVPVITTWSLDEIDPSGTVINTYATAPQPSPNAITIDNLGNVYVVGSSNNQVYKTEPLTFITTPYGNLPSSTNLTSLVIDSVGNVYVACNNDIQVAKVTPSGVTTVFTIFNLPPTQPYGLAIDSSDNIYVSNPTLEAVFKVTPSGVRTVYGSTGAGNQPYYIAIDSLENIYTANSNGTVSKILATGGTMLLADFSVYGATLFAITVDIYFNVYVTDTSNNVVYLVVQ